MSVLHQWALRDLEGAATWVAAWGEGDLRTRGMTEIKGLRRHRQTAVRSSR